MLVPVLEPLVFIGKNLAETDEGSFYFQDAQSHRQGVRFESGESEDASFYVQRHGELNHIFEYERALDILLSCSMRRRDALNHSRLD
jgi:hypothetical protein